jgi:hypothetical protein
VGGTRGVAQGEDESEPESGPESEPEPSWWWWWWRLLLAAAADLDGGWSTLSSSLSMMRLRSDTELLIPSFFSFGGLRSSLLCCVCVDTTPLQLQLWRLK